MRRLSHRAFTLVELLVVIAIISMLIALLLPAVLSGQEQARQVQCQKQMKDISSASIQYAMRKKRFPGFADTWSVTDLTPATININVGWVPQLFSYLDMNERDRRLKTWTDQDQDTNPDHLEFIAFFTCPSDPPDLEAVLWSEDDCGSAAPSPNAPLIRFPTSYAVNAGRPDDSSEPTPDTAQYALFHDRRSTATKKVGVSMDDITDGKHNTLVVTENVDLVSWTAVSESHQGVVFFDDFDTGGTTVSTVAFNEAMIAPYDCGATSDTPLAQAVYLADNLDYGHARPSSFHQEGFNMAYADGSVDFFFVDPANPNASYLLYRAKLTPANRD